MSTLTEVDKRYLEKILGMESGYLLDYNDMTFGQFFNRHRVDIHGAKYQAYGTSKAKKMRAFWESEPDALVGKVLSEMLDVYEASCKLNNNAIDAAVLQESRKSADRLLGKPQSEPSLKTGDDFLNREFAIPNIQNLPIAASVVPIIESRLAEARKALGIGAHLSVIFLCGSVLEAVLLGAAQKEPARFNQAAASPKANDGKVKYFPDWSLAQFIDVACEIDLLKPDVKKFSHGLRDFRNYIHPYEQMVSRFTPDEHTAKLCFQVLKAALASVAGERK
ncbi:hypothetical protein [Herbaspirillum chlorophenolicum]|jgi:hypothetical protein|uniref:hypothetical protein n=1 Tax=Herbaspirillum chlorophenolicum TaxID=211589 RepID=UPI00067DF24D|nr:hypothetical protein [Herbaspirillum chlorophenolicum]